MRRIFLRVAYDGTNYHGFQIQPNAETIEGVLNRELSRILKEDITVIGASRTDAGVHAFGNVAVFDTNAKIPGAELVGVGDRLLQDPLLQFLVLYLHGGCSTVCPVTPRGPSRRPAPPAAADTVVPRPRRPSLRRGAHHPPRDRLSLAVRAQNPEGGDLHPYNLPL